MGFMRWVFSEPENGPAWKLRDEYAYAHGGNACHLAFGECVAQEKDAAQSAEDHFKA